jgi:iron complex transport system substrate-binding protein
MNVRAFSRRGLALVAALALFACRADAKSSTTRGTPTTETRHPSYPVEVRDDLGRAVTLRAQPHRIVSLLPSHTETLFALGLGDRVVGVDDYSDDPDEAAHLPKLGGLYDAHLEEIVSLAPDLVIASESMTSIAALEETGVVVWAGSAHTFDDVFRVIGVIGRLVDRSDEAERISDRIRDEASSLARRMESRPRVRVYYELDSTPYTVGPSSFIGVMLRKAGGDNVIPAGLGDFPRVSPELVIAENPEIILGASLDEVAARPGWARVAAVLSGRVEALPPRESRLVARPGPRIAEGIRALARRLHPGVEP